VRYYHNHSLDGATLFSKLDSNKLRFNVKNEMTLICAKFDADFVNISKVTSRKTKWPRFFWPSRYVRDVDYRVYVARSNCSRISVVTTTLAALLCFTLHWAN